MVLVAVLVAVLVVIIMIMKHVVVLPACAPTLPPPLHHPINLQPSRIVCHHALTTPSLRLCSKLLPAADGIQLQDAGRAGC